MQVIKPILIPVVLHGSHDHDHWLNLIIDLNYDGFNLKLMIRKGIGSLVLLFLFIYVKNGLSQDQTAQESSFRKWDIFPAISYAPETNLTLGATGFYYFDLSNEKGTANRSHINFLGIYTLAKQIAIENKWEIFTPNNDWRFIGEMFYLRFPDRNYGLGNDAKNLIREWNEEGVIDTINYLSYQSDIFRFAPIILKRIETNFYLGLHGEFEHIYRKKILSDRFEYLNDSTAFTNLPIEETYSGLGLQLTYDDRDYILNPLRGNFISFKNAFYRTFFGSSCQFQKFMFDIRKYFNVHLNHTLAFRTAIYFRNGKDPIPVRALSRVGGRELIRGYYKGTFQDQNLTAIEVEYRLPFWKGDIQGPWWHIWKRSGMVIFGGTAQVFNKKDGFKINRFNWALGTGLRILFNQKSRANLRFDYAIGLKKESGGPGKTQSGFYVALAEAF